MIYVLTCPCREFDYVGETAIAFCDRLLCKNSRERVIHLIVIVFLGHHRHVTRIIHEFLIGPINVDRPGNPPKSTEFVFLLATLLQRRMFDIIERA